MANVPGYQHVFLLYFENEDYPLSTIDAGNIGDLVAAAVTG